MKLEKSFLPERKCPKCNKAFNDRKPNAIYCGVICKRRSEGDRYYAKNALKIKIRRITGT